jgi:hypothetical protein
MPKLLPKVDFSRIVELAGTLRLRASHTLGEWVSNLSANSDT